MLVALVLSPVLSLFLIMGTASGLGGPGYFALALVMPSFFTWLGGSLLRREPGEIALGALGSVFAWFGLWLLLLLWLQHSGAFDT